MTLNHRRSRQTVIKALKWLDKQPHNWAAHIKDTDVAVKMYLKSQRAGGESNKEEDFAAEIKTALWQKGPQPCGLKKAEPAFEDSFFSAGKSFQEKKNGAGKEQRLFDSGEEPAALLRKPKTQKKLKSGDNKNPASAPEKESPDFKSLLNSFLCENDGKNSKAGAARPESGEAGESRRKFSAPAAVSTDKTEKLFDKEDSGKGSGLLYNTAPPAKESAFSSPEPRDSFFSKESGKGFLLDKKSLEAVQQAKNKLNIKSDEEALRALIQIGKASLEKAFSL